MMSNLPGQTAQIIHNVLLAYNCIYATNHILRSQGKKQKQASTGEWHGVPNARMLNVSNARNTEQVITVIVRVSRS